MAVVRDVLHMSDRISKNTEYFETEKVLSYRGAKLRNTFPTVTIIKAKPFPICNFCHIIYFDILLHARLYWKPILCNSVLRTKKSPSI